MQLVTLIELVLENLFFMSSFLAWQGFKVKLLSKGVFVWKQSNQAPHPLLKIMFEKFKKPKNIFTITATFIFSPLKVQKIKLHFNIKWCFHNIMIVQLLLWRTVILKDNFCNTASLYIRYICGTTLKLLVTIWWILLNLLLTEVAVVVSVKCSQLTWFSWSFLVTIGG